MGARIATPLKIPATRKPSLSIFDGEEAIDEEEITRCIYNT
jgi:hypothetical protein